MKLLTLLPFISLFAIPTIASPVPIPEEYGSYGSYPAPEGGYGSYAGDGASEGAAATPAAPEGGYGSYPAPEGGYGDYGAYKRNADAEEAKRAAQAS